MERPVYYLILFSLKICDFSFPVSNQSVVSYDKYHWPLGDCRLSQQCCSKFKSGDAVFCELFLACRIIVPSPSEWSSPRRMTVLVGLLIQ